jgi:two-component system C4-dicarboxylate transport sensor histidine kinase DctB
MECMSIAAYFSSHPRSSLAGLAFRFMAALAACILVGWVVREEVLVRQLGALRQQTLHTIEFYRLSLESLLSRNESLPRVVAMEAKLKALLQHPESDSLRLAANRYLLEVRNGADINAAYLIDGHGLTLASSNFRQPSSYVGNNYSYRPYFRAAMGGKLGSFYGIGTTTGDPGYFLTAPIEVGGEKIGAATVKVSLENFESALVRSGDTVLLVDALGVIFLASVPEWKYRTLKPLDAETLAQLEASRQYNNRPLLPLETRLQLQGDPQLIRTALPDTPAQDYLLQSKETGSLGWSIVLLTRTQQARQNALLAGIAAGFAMAFLLSSVIYLRLNARRFMERRQAEADLRQAHKALEQHIAERTADLRATNASLEEKIESLKTAESILRETRDNAVQAGKLAVLGQMAAGISHEVNQPLTALHNFTDNAVQLLDRGRLGEVRDNLGLIKQMAVRMGHIVGEIKTFSRKPALERQRLRVADVMAQAVMMVEPRIRQIGAQIEIRSPDGELSVWADQQRLEQVLVNLLINGLDALDALAEAAERRLEVVISDLGREVSISIRDSGAGIPDAVMPHLFEPFFTTKTAGKGLGLGLPISRMIVSELGGRIDVRNSARGGAEFIVILEKA